MNLVLNTGYVKWGKPLMEDGDAIDGLTRTGLKVTLLPNLQVTREVVTDGGGGACSRAPLPLSAPYFRLLRANQKRDMLGVHPTCTLVFTTRSTSQRIYASFCS